MQTIIAKLKDIVKDTSATEIREAFASDPARFDKYHVRFEDLLMDYSKAAVNEQVFALLTELADSAGVAAKREAMFSGEIINITEQRAVLHTALRNRSNTPVVVDGKDVMGDVNAVLAAMGEFAEGVRSGKITGATGKKITDVVNIGIGGSDLGPVMTTLTLAPFHDGPRSHYVSNIDPAHIADTIKLLNPETSLFIVASKTFTTIETMTNAKTARAFIAKALGEGAVQHHFAAVSTALDKVAAFGIDRTRVFGFWDWVGGRYSLWSAVSLSVIIAAGYDVYERLLAGAHEMDQHFLTAPLEKNAPVLLAAAQLYNRIGLSRPSRAVIPYIHRLRRLAAFLQQLEMESNGKRTSPTGELLDTQTCPVVFGDEGTNAQHAFFQMLHQSEDIVPLELIAAANNAEVSTDMQQKLLSNVIAQGEAFMVGKSLETSEAECRKLGFDDAKTAQIAPQKVCPGNKPSTTVLLNELTPETLGGLLAMYEHKTFVEGIVMGLNSFDQWGVELGKTLGVNVLKDITGSEIAVHDPSTTALIKRIKK